MEHSSVKRLLACHSLSRAIILLRQRKTFYVFQANPCTPLTHTHAVSYTNTHINALCLPHTLKLILSPIHTHTHKTKPLNPRQKVGMRNQDSLCIVLSGGSNNLEQKAMQTKALPSLLLLTWVAGVAAGLPLPTSRLEPVATQRLRSPPILLPSYLALSPQMGSLYSSPPLQG